MTHPPGRAAEPGKTAPATFAPADCRFPGEVAKVRVGDHRRHRGLISRGRQPDAVPARLHDTLTCASTSPLTR
jgi:hypothetical protein